MDYDAAIGIFIGGLYQIEEAPLILSLLGDFIIKFCPILLYASTEIII